MNKSRFNDLKGDTDLLLKQITDKFPDTGEFIKSASSQLGNKYPELVDERTRTQVKSLLNTIEKELRNSKNRDRQKDYTGVESSIKRDNPEQCIDSVNLLSKAIGDSKRKIIYFSCLQGELLSSVKESTTKKTFTSLLKLTQVSNSLMPNFLINLHKLVDMYPELVYCELPIRFFQKNYGTIKKIGQKNPDEWK